MPLPQLTKTANSFTPFTFERARFLPVKEPITANQTTGKAGGGAVKVADHGTAEQFKEIVLNNVSATNRNNLLGFIQDSTVNYRENTCTFIDEASSSFTVRIWNVSGLDFPQVRGGNYNIRLILRIEI